MATHVFLGKPPADIEAWIISHSTPPGPISNPKTVITFIDNTTQEYDWSGTITQQTMVDAGLFDSSHFIWIAFPKTITIGTQVTTITDDAFDECDSLINLSFCEGIQVIGDHSFSNCDNLTNVTLP